MVYTGKLYFSITFVYGGRNQQLGDKNEK